MLFPFLTSHAKSEGVNPVALFYLAGVVALFGLMAHWATSTLGARPSDGRIAVPTMALSPAALDQVGDMARLRCQVVGGCTPVPVATRAGYGGSIVRDMGAVVGLPTGVSTVDLQNVTQGRVTATVVPTSTPAPTSTPWPVQPTRAIEPFKVYVFAEPETVNQIVVEYPYLVLTHQALPPGVSILQAGLVDAPPTALPRGVCPWGAGSPNCDLVTYVTRTPVPCGSCIRPVWAGFPLRDVWRSLGARSVRIP